MVEKLPCLSRKARAVENPEPDVHRSTIAGILQALRFGGLPIMNSNTKRYLAEAFGTAVLILVGCGAAAIGGAAEGRTLVDVIGIGFAFGLAITAMVYGIGPISGCHINPAVTVGMLAAGRMTVSDAIGYIVAQLVGAIIGAGILLLILKGRLAGYDVAAGGLGQNGWGVGYLGGYGMGSAIIVEFLATLIFVVVILAVTSSPATGAVAGLVIGLTLFMLHFPFINVTGLSANPARSLGPAIFVGGQALAQVWLFLVVPTVAGAVAGWLFKCGLLVPDSSSK
jgi:aquaporin Z